MKKLSKIVLASSIVFGTVLGVNVVNGEGAENQVEAAQTPWYNYNGYTAASSNFVLDKNFKTALKYDNVKINGYKLTSNKSAPAKELVVKDQIFYKVSNHKADQVAFNLDGHTITPQKLINVYGQPVEKPVESAVGKVYKYKIGNKTVQFFVDKGHVYRAQINS
ncbi:immunodominant staphylococcal antigen IsaB family protein [Staphylococcus shinii]|uniref:immunodominant staphylococcal antigen IsaB family protein n=1 Tax=Staphylococcus shinii TaxID=2912228 RepID=UPI003F554450